MRERNPSGRERRSAEASQLTPDGIGRGAVTPALIVGVVGLLVCAFGVITRQPGFFRSYLFAYLFWVGMALGMLILVLLHHLMRGQWGFPIQRLAEAGARTLPLMAVLFLPLLLGMGELYPWARPEEVARSAVLQHKSAYLNVPFFVARTAVYFAIWIFYAYRVSHLSLELDRTAQPGILAKLRGLTAPGLIVMTLTLTFASIDWIMSLEPEWTSTIYGLMVAIGMVLEAFSLLIVLVALLGSRSRNNGNIGKALSRQIFNDLGALLLTFVMLWAYFSFSQFMLIWAGNLTEEIPWYLRRLANGWQVAAGLILVLHFALPFALLIFRDIKRDARKLAAVAGLLVVMRLVDAFWLVVPAGGGRSFGITIFDIAAVIGIGGLWVAFYAWNLGTRPLMPAVFPQPSPGRSHAAHAEHEHDALTASGSRREDVR